MPIALIANFLIKKSDEHDEAKREAKGRNRNRKLANLSAHSFRFVSPIPSGDLVSQFLNYTQLPEQPGPVKPMLYVGSRRASGAGARLTIVNGSLARSRFQIVLDCTTTPGGCRGTVSFADTSCFNTEFRDDVEDAEQSIIWVEQCLLNLGVTNT